jgi:hypothetical protein
MSALEAFCKMLFLMLCYVMCLKGKENGERKQRF